MNASTPVIDLQWQLCRFADLSPDDLYDLLRLRAEVFVVEQRCAYLDLDDKDRDPAARHLLGRVLRQAQDERGAGTLAAYLRLLPPGLSYPEASFGRVVTASAFRGRGLGDELVRVALQHLAQLWPSSGIRIGAQAHLVGYYGKHEFEVASEEYLEDDIPHREMRRASTR